MTRDGNGVLSGEPEVGAGEHPAVQFARGAGLQHLPSGHCFSYLDVNNNGYIDRNEWDGSLDTFLSADRDNDGRITRPELNNGC